MDIQALKDQNPLHTIVEQYTNLKRVGSTFSACCPIHKEKTPSFHVYPKTNTFKCYGCNAKGDVIAFIQRVHNTDFKEACRILDSSCTFSSKTDFKPVEVMKKPSIIGYLDPAKVDRCICPFSLANHEFGKAIVDKVGIDFIDMAMLYNIGISSTGRIIFFQHDGKGYRCGKRVQYNGSKRDKNVTPDWIKPDNFKQCTFGFHLVDGSKTVFIVESEKTAVAMATKYSKYTWVATAGASNIDRTIREVKPLAKKGLALVPDADKVQEWSTKGVRIIAFEEITGKQDIGDYYGI